MARGKMLFGQTAVRDLLRLKDVAAVERLVISGILEVSAYTARGAPLFEVDAIRSAADKVVFIGREGGPSS
jgi:hypothetical protein